MAEIIINGPEGRIEGKYHHCEIPHAPIVLILHPHPLHGGTMNNKVVYNMYQKFVENDFSVLRFNFRGVGRSQGVYDGGAGELVDAATALDWLQLYNPSASSVWIAGFSFGSWIGLQLLMRRPEIQNFVAVSPPVNKYDFSFLSPCPSRGFIVQGNQDSIVSESAVTAFVSKISKQKTSEIKYSVIDEADHFFRTKLDELNEEIDDYIKYCLHNENPKKTKTDRRRRSQSNNED